MNILSDIMNGFVIELSKEIDLIIKKGIEQKGYNMFENMEEMAQYLKENGRIEVLGNDETYFIDNKPFLLIHKNEFKSPTYNDNIFKFQYGMSYKYL
jgi:hypothetical protein